MLGFSLTHPMDVLTIPTAYKKYLSVGVSSLKKKINKKGFKFSYTSHAGVFLCGISSLKRNESHET